MSRSNIHTEDLIEFAKILGQQTDFKEIIRLVANSTAQLLNADIALILMLNPDTHKTIKTIFVFFYFAPWRLGASYFFFLCVLTRESP